MPDIAITYSDLAFKEDAEKLADSLQLTLKPDVDTHVDTQFSIFLVLTPQGLQLQATGPKAPGPVMVDFIGGALGHRLRFGGGRRQLIGRAVGMAPKKILRVIDVTAGLGRDAGLLASLGCHVTMVERSPVIVALLNDGLLRAQQDPKLTNLPLELIKMDAVNYLKALSETEYPDVVYLDPMFSELKKTAAVKKEMRVLKQVLVEDNGAETLFYLSRDIAKKRVVVKRHRHAPRLVDVKPDLVFDGKSTRFDVYLS